jgi:hypothetical protein
MSKLIFLASLSLKSSWFWALVLESIIQVSVSLLFPSNLIPLIRVLWISCWCYHIVLSLAQEVTGLVLIFVCRKKHVAD